MIEQETLIAALQEADVTQDDWYWGPLEALTDMYAKGYLKAFKEHACGNCDDEELRDALIMAAGWGIWGET